MCTAFYRIIKGEHYFLLQQILNEPFPTKRNLLQKQSPIKFYRNLLISSFKVIFRSDAVNIRKHKCDRKFALASVKSLDSIFPHIRGVTTVELNKLRSMNDVTIWTLVDVNTAGLRLVATVILANHEDVIVVCDVTCKMVFVIAGSSWSGQLVCGVVVVSGEGERHFIGVAVATQGHTKDEGYLKFLR